MIGLRSDDDANDGLRNTDSEDASAASGDDGDEPVLCRCGARDWQDGTQWIQCDARGCRRWEHLRCAYPVEDDPEGESASPPEVHLCNDCSAMGPPAAAGNVRRGGRRCLTRCGDGATSSPTKTSSDDGTRGGDDSGGAGTSRVRRSQRVSGKERRRIPLKKNVVGEDLSSSSSDEIDVDPGGSLNDERDLGVGSDGDEFWAPEGKVETSQEYRCRCGGTLQDGDAIGGGGEGGNVSSQWVQCHSDHCGVWEHAACCEHGCSLAPSTQASATKLARRHWCRACDPTGKKHAKWEEKKTRNKLKRELIAKGKGASAAHAGSALTIETGGARGKDKNQADGRARALLGDIWRAVISGNASLLEEIFREADGGSERSHMSVERLLAAGHPPSIDCWDVRSSLSGGGVGDREVIIAIGDDSPVFHGYPFPAGLSLLMLAAGYWSNVADAFAASSASAASATPAGAAGAAAAATAPAHTESAPERTPIVMGVRSVAPESSTSRGSAVVCNAETAVPGSPSTAANAADTKTGKEAPAQNEACTEGGACADLAGVMAPLASGESLAVSATNTGLPQLGSEARLAVLRIVLERSGARAVLAADGEGRTAVHHAAAVNGAAEAALLLGGELGGKAALAKVNHAPEA